MSERARIFVWTLYDFANTSFSIVVVTFLYAVYFKETVAGGEAIGDFYWSLSTSVSMLIVALVAPTLGAVADYTSSKKKFLLFFTALCLAAAGSLYFVGPGEVALGMGLFVVANVGFEAALVFYDAFLPEITEPRKFGRVSGYGFAFGYFGALASLGLAFPFIQAEMVRETFPVSALFFLVFSLPLFLKLKERRVERDADVNYVAVGARRVLSTIRNLKEYKNLAVFLLAYFFYIEGVNTVIFFAGIYASGTLGFEMLELIYFFVVVQTTAIVGATVLGVVADAIGQRRTIMLTLVMWLVTVSLAFFVEDKTQFYFVGLLAGAAMGSSQSTSRALMSLLTPDDKKTEFFGFYSFFGKSSAILGPLAFGAISYATGSQRVAILSVAVFFLVGMTILRFVKDPSHKPLANLFRRG